MNNKRPASRSSLYVLEGNPGIGKAFPYSVQQILSMFVTNLVPIGIIGAAAMPALSQEEILVLVQNAMIVSGIATIIQATPIWKLGSGLPIFMGVSFTFVVPLSAIAAKNGYGAVIGSVLAGGLLEGLMGLTVKYWKRLMAPIVSALVVTGIGLSLLSVGARSFGGGYAEDFGSVHNLVTGTVTILACLLWMIHAKGAKRQLSILVGLAAGYVTALLFGDRIEIEGADGETIETILFDETDTITVLGKKKLNIYNGGRVIQIAGGDRFNALKYVNLYYRFKNAQAEKNGGTEGVKFLGL